MSWFKKEEEVFGDWTVLKTSEGLEYYYNTKTQVTTWDKPEELRTDEDNEELVWCPHPKEVFVLAKIINEVGTKVNLEGVDGEEYTVKKGTILTPVKKMQLDRLTPDLVLLDEMSDALILHNLRMRFEMNKIYTSIGTILIAINPYTWLDLYSQKIIRHYERKLRNYEEVAPHVFVISDQAYKGLTFKGGKKQSIIISGESGAGKTECTKQCLKYLSEISGSISGVEDKVLQSNPILEAFGNAKTVRNNNSSRFGKFVEIFFTEKYELCGAHTSNYLLEKIRVIKQMNGERNFHIFYQLGKSSLAKKYFLNAPSKHHYTNQSEIDAEGIDDNKEFAELMEAFKTLNFEPSDTEDLFQLIAGILHLGDANFNLIGEKKCTLKSKKPTENASKLFKIDKSKLEFALMNRLLKMKGESQVITVSFGKEDCEHARDALAKFIYGYLFDWIVREINKSLTPNVPKSDKNIGILDIFGFEIFESNSFEQLCINYTNEKLQQNFNLNVFKKEEQIYRSEKVEFKHVPFIDNQPILDLIEKGPKCILQSLDEEVKLPKGDDAKYLIKLDQTHEKNKFYTKEIKRGKTFFTLVHYAGPVSYDTTGFVEKSRDTLSEDLLQLMESSELGLIKKILPHDSSANRKRTLGYVFSQQVNSLMEKLYTTDSHYIRCVKPNENKRPGEFTPIMCHEQLKYSGAFEAVKIRKAGFPFRLKHADFVERYSCTIGQPDKKGGTRQDCAKLIGNPKFKFEKNDIQIGKTMVLYRSDENRVLELYRSIEVEKKTLDKRLSDILAEAPEKYDPSKEEFFERFYRLVQRANELKFQSAVADKARTKLEMFIETRMDPETKRILAECIKTPDLDKINSVLDICEERMYETKDVKKVREIQEKLHKVVEDLEDAIKSVSRKKLEDSTKEGREYNLKMDVFITACALLEKVTQIDEEATNGINDVDEFVISAALEKANEINYRNDLTAKASELLDKILLSNSELENSTFAVVEEDMAVALKRADEINLKSTQYQNCLALYQQVVLIHADEKEATAKRDAVEMAAVIGRAKAVNLRSPQIMHCIKMCARINRIFEEESRANNTLVEAHMRAVLKAADEINLGTEITQKFKDLLLLEKKEFIKEQIIQSTEVKDKTRLIWLEIELKSIFFENYSGQYNFGKYGKLKIAQHWAAENLFSLKKAALEANFLSFQVTPIHSTLTKFKKAENKSRMEKNSKKFFKAIMAYMGDYTKVKTSPDMLIYEMLENCCLEPRLRNEQYIQVIKQIQNNPSSQSVEKGWDLLKLMIYTFPPEDSFENFLEKYLRDNCNKKDVYIPLLHHRIHDGNETFYAPDISKFDTILSDNSTDGFDEILPENPSWADLEHSYLGKDGTSNPDGLTITKPAQIPQKPPTGQWSKHFDESSGFYFYVDDSTGNSTWDKPEGFVD